MIKTHLELAKAIEGKKILLMNSFGKDSILCLEWLANFAKPAQVISMSYLFFAGHPHDKKYLDYLQRRYPSVAFLTDFNAFDVTRILTGEYQSPLDVLNAWQDQDFDFFDHQAMTEDIRKELGCDFVAYGMSRYESFDRANYFHRKGLMDETTIYPLGMMSKAQVLGLLKSSGVKLHPTYKLTKSTLDRPNYYKFRSTFIAYPEFKKQVLAIYPLLALDEYRWEVLFEKGRT